MQRVTRGQHTKRECVVQSDAIWPRKARKREVRHEPDRKNQAVFDLVARIISTTLQSALPKAVGGNLWNNLTVQQAQLKRRPAQASARGKTRGSA